MAKEPTRYKKIYTKDPDTGHRIEHVIAVDKPRGVKTLDWEGDWDKRMIKLASKGATWQELAAQLRISHKQWRGLIKRDEQFAEVVEICKERSEAWWLRQGRTNLANKDFSGSLYYSNMKNRYGWRDRTDLTSKDEKLPTPILAIKNVVNEEAMTQEERMKEIEAEEAKEIEENV